MASRLPVTYPSQPAERLGEAEPASSPFDFTWEVPADGHQWTDAIVADLSPDARGKGRGVFLTSGEPVGGRCLVRRSTPLRSEPALFLKFSELDLSKEAFRAFANLHGLLGGEATTHIALPRVVLQDRSGISVTKPGAPAMFLAVGETFASWAAQASDMRRLVEIWSAVTRSPRRLTEWIHWEGGQVLYRHERSFAVIAGPQIRSELLERLRPGELVGPALSYLQQEINDELTRRVSARLLWDRSRGQLRLLVVPQSLIGAMWLQFAHALEGGRRYAHCRECKEWMELSPQVRRSDAEYCSGACRTRAYRRRQRQRTKGRRLPGRASPTRS